ncbi:MAG: hypothetical protein GXP55_20270 [Deltaproteobacteria bacterium]|nr:hypothetical protein [Deltaproteobacteria bacterium]
MHASLLFARGARSLRFVILAALVTLIGLPSLTTPASAQMPQRITVGDGSVMCAPLPACDPAMITSCSGVRGNCRSLPGHSWSYCTNLRAPESEAFCCTGDSDCPTVSGSSGNCATVTGLVDASPGVCLDTTKDWCVGDLGEIDIIGLAQCLRPPVGVIVRPGTAPSWKKGDCDRDGVANGLDGCPCRMGRGDGPTPGCPSLTADAGVSDAGIPSTDASVVLDAAPADATVVDDGGVIIDPTDGGPPVDDAGRPTDDAGAGADASILPVPDAASSAEAGPREDASTGGTFTGAGGCSLAGGRSGSSGAPAAALLLALLGLAIRRRR